MKGKTLKLSINGNKLICVSSYQHKPTKRNPIKLLNLSTLYTLSLKKNRFQTNLQFY